MAREEGKIGIERFDDTYFEYWKMQIEDYLCGGEKHMPFMGTKWMA
jgi:hypothetical protein